VRVWRLCLLLDYLSLDEPAVVSTILPYVRPSAEIDSQLIVTKDQVAQMTPSPFLDLDQFPRLLPLKEAWIALRDEVRDLGDDRLPIDRDGKSHTEVWDEVASHMAANGTYGWMQGWGQPDVRRNWRSGVSRLQPSFGWPPKPSSRCTTILNCAKRGCCRCI
jgi:hypothetical protein